MNLRTLSLTVGALVVLCGVVWFIQRPASPASADPRLGEPVLSAAAATDAAQIKITDQGKTVTLTRQSDGQWIVNDYHDFPADFPKLSRLITNLHEAKLQRLVTSRGDRLERLGFGNSHVTLLDSAGQQLVHLALGKTAEGGGRFVRFGEETKGYLADLSVWLDSGPKSWADATLLSLKTDDITRVEIGFADASVAPVIATREKKEDTFAAAEPPEGKRLNASRVTSLLNNLVSLRFTETSALDDASAQAAREHSRTIKLTTFAGEAYTIALGRKPEEKKPKAAPAPAEAKSETGGAPAESEAAPAITDNKPAEPEYETIPAGPVFVFISSSNADARVNALMQKRAFQIGEWTFTSLPANADEFWEDVPAPSETEKKE